MTSRPGTGSSHRPAPQDIIDKLAREIVAANNDPAFIERLKTLGVDPSRVAGDEFKAVINKDMDIWRNRVADMGLKLR